MALDNFREVFMPYCIDRVPNGLYIVLNREYMPLGAHTRHPIHYEDYPYLVKIKGLGPAMARKLSCDGKGTIEKIYLYGGGACGGLHTKERMDDYLRRLSMLAKLIVQPGKQMDPRASIQFQQVPV